MLRKFYKRFEEVKILLAKVRKISKGGALESSVIYPEWMEAYANVAP